MEKRKNLKKARRKGYITFREESIRLPATFLIKEKSEENVII